MYKGKTMRTKRFIYITQKVIQPFIYITPKVILLATQLQYYPLINGIN